MHYYQFNIGDYAKATRHLSNNEDLAYRRLIELYYDTEKPLAADIKKLSRLINMRENEQDIEVVLDDFFIESENGYTQNRIEREIINYHSKADKARANGKLGGRPKKADANPKETKGKAKKTQPVNLANPDLTGLKANQEPLTTNQELLTNKKIKVPYQLIVDEYHRIIPELPKMNILTDKRKRLIKRLFDFNEDHKDIEWWAWYFNFVRGSDHLMNRIERTGQHANWKCDLEWLVDINNFAKIYDKRYHQ